MATAQEISELKVQIALACRILGVQGVTRGSFGHVSVRIPGEVNKFLIKSKGPDETALEFATAHDIITIDEEGAELEAPDGLQAPNETAMHLAVYRNRPEVNSVIHAHPDWVVVLTAVEKPLLPIYGAYNPGGLHMAMEGIPLYPKSAGITDTELGEDFMQSMGTKDVCMLRGHGITAAGRSLERATNNAFTIYELARLNYLAYAIGEPKVVPEALESGGPREGRTRRPRREYDRDAAMWKYYRQILGEA